MHDALLQSVVAEQKFPLIFVTISGAHLYGFASPDSDFDLRGVHVLPLADVIGLKPAKETIEFTGDREGAEIDLVTHDAKKFFGLMMKKNGYVLEQLFSPLIVHTTPEHAELRAIGKGCITKFHAYHYLGFALTQWNLFAKENPRRIKPLLYVYRVLLTGIHLMKSGAIEANLVKLNELYPLAYVPELIHRKTTQREQATLTDADFDFHQGEYQHLRQQLEDAHLASHLPSNSTSGEALHDLLVRIRTARGNV